MSIAVKVRNGNLEGALSAFKNRVDRSGVLDEFKRRQEFIKPSQRRREAKKQAIRNAEKDRRANS